MTEKRREGRGAVETGPTAATVAANVRRIRELVGLSTYQLSKALADAGRPITASAISKLERGARRVDVDDLMALAVALRVNPSALLLPDTIEGDAEITGGGRVDARRAWQWADGDKPLHIPAGDDGTAELDFTRFARPRGLRMRFNVRTPAGRRAALGSIADDDEADT